MTYSSASQALLSCAAQPLDTEALRRELRRATLAYTRRRCLSRRPFDAAAMVCVVLAIGAALLRATGGAAAGEPLCFR